MQEIRNISKAALDEQKAVLYDFLYQDHDRVGSFYSQFLNGVLMSRADTTQIGNKSVGKVGGNVGIAKADGEHERSTSNTTVETRSPGDLTVIDVLGAFSDSGRLNYDVRGASNGSVVVGRGNISFFDRGLVELAFGVIAANPQGKQDKNFQAGAKTLREMLAKLDVPPFFVMQCEDGAQLFGALKASGMRDVISSYYLKHGGSSLQNVSVVGTKEVGGPPISSGVQLGGIMLPVAQQLTALIFPTDGIRVVPLTIFREL